MKKKFAFTLAEFFLSHFVSCSKNAYTSAEALSHFASRRKTAFTSAEALSHFAGLSTSLHPLPPRASLAMTKGTNTSLVKGRGRRRDCLLNENSTTADATLTPHPSPLPQGAREKRCAFTLAEVLITLGIIGVVAAMTLPALITKHQKKVVATRVKQFASVWQQAYRQVEYEQGGSLSVTLGAKDPEAALNAYNETFGKYVRTMKVEKSRYGITGALQNGSGFYYYHFTRPNESVRNYLIFCPYYKDCKQLADNGPFEDSETISDGKKTFGFWIAGNTPTYAWDGTREWLMQKCSTWQKGYCTTLIQYDGWEIKDDYPAW